MVNTSVFQTANPSAYKMKQKHVIINYRHKRRIFFPPHTFLVYSDSFFPLFEWKAAAEIPQLQLKSIAVGFPGSGTKWLREENKNKAGANGSKSPWRSDWTWHLPVLESRRCLATFPPCNSPEESSLISKQKVSNLQSDFIETKVVYAVSGDNEGSSVLACDWRESSGITPKIQSLGSGFLIDRLENIHAVAGSPRQGLHVLEGLVMVRQ